MNIIPKPNGKLIQTEGCFTLRPQMKASCGDFDVACLEAFAERAKVRFETTQAGADVTLLREDLFAPEEYALEVKKDAVVIRAKTEAGVILALTTLYLNIGADTVPCFTLEDKPRYAHRGQMLDCVRHFFSADETKKVIEEISLAKLNKLHWHLCDDQGWRIESLAFPALHEGIPHYTREEIREIVRFAKLRNVEIIPEIDMPGHTTSAIHALPWLSCSGREVERATEGGIYKTILCAGKESTYEFVFKVLDELIELFESPKIHIGGDEAPKIEWEQCPACKKRLAELGSENFEDLQGYFTNRIADYLAAKGRQVVCWNEILRAEKLPEGLTVQYWMPGTDDEKALAFLAEGRPLVFSNMFKLYLDYPHFLTPLKKVYNYTPAIGDKSCEDAPGVLGLETCLWSERVDSEEKLEKQIFPRVFALAEAAWSYEKDYDDFERRLESKVEGLRESGIFYTPSESYNPDAEAKAAGLAELVGVIAQATEDHNDNKLSITDMIDSGEIERFLAGFEIDASLLGGLLV